MSDKYCYPIEPAHPGKPSLQVASEAQDRRERRREWREQHPTEPMPESMWDQENQDYRAEERVENLPGWGGMTFEPGDGLVPRKG